jgi:hypothetical protein
MVLIFYLAHTWHRDETCRDIEGVGGAREANRGGKGRFTGF